MNPTYKLIKSEKLRLLQTKYEKSIASNLAATLFIKEIENGNLNASFSADVNQDEELITALLAMQSQLQKISSEEKERNWATEGLAMFAEILRADNENSKEFYQNIISKLIKYLEANQGGLFLVDDQDTSHITIEMVSSYAYNRQKFLTKRIVPGEGLIGQCYLEKETILLNNVPQNYIEITSGLGTSNPDYLIIVPLKVNDQVHGFVELASFKPLRPYQVDFLEKLGESIASSLSSLKINQRTKRLLEATQDQAEQMRAQEEELRQNMEELGTTQEEMTRVSVEMEGQLLAINKTMATIEFDLNGNIITANENFLQLMEYNLQEIAGKHHRLFVETNERQSEGYKEFWEQLHNGKSVVDEFKRVSKSGKEVYIKGIYSPILDQSGSPKKVLKIAYDITASKAMELQIKRQLDEAQAIEEEIRQNMEELGATQEEMARVNAEMEGQLVAINTTMATIEFDLNGKVLTANENFLQLMEYGMEEIVSKHHKIFVDSDESKTDEYKEFWQKLSKGEGVTGEFKRLTKSGKVVYIKGIYNPILDQAGTPKKVLKIAYDITANKEMELQIKRQLDEAQAIEEEIRQNMEELGATQEEMARVNAEMEGQLVAINTTMATIEFDLNGKILTANENFLQLMEYGMEEIAHKHHKIFVDSNESKTDEYKAFWQKLSGGEGITGEFKRLTKSGKVVYIKGIYNPILDQAGTPKKVLKIAYDITANKEMELQIKNQLDEAQAIEEEIRQNMEELGATQEEMARVSAEMEGQLAAINKTMATIEFDLLGNILAANENFLQLLGYKMEEIKGKHHRIFVESSESESKEYKQFWKKLANGEGVIGEFKRLSKSGKSVYIKGIYNPILDQAGKPKKVLKIAYDITGTIEKDLIA